MVAMRFTVPVLLGFAASVGATALCAWPAAAQSIDNQATRPVTEPSTNQAPAAKLPPGLPGAQSRSDAAPIDRIPADMPPNQALFDAINRGDIASARDALNRGADIDARNVLGMTPIDSAIDLGRNDIAFLLLSMRGSGPSSSPPSTAANAAPATPGKSLRTARGPHRGPVERVASNAAPATPAARTPRLFAGDGGAPAPQVGFLGFDTARPR